MASLYLEVYGDYNSCRSRIGTGCGWVLLFDAENNCAVLSGRIE